MLIVLVVLLLSGAAATWAPVASATGGWYAQTSGTNATLSGVDFPDASHGWAVGQAGTILATTDGGATWTVQHPASLVLDLFGVSFPDVTHGWAVSTVPYNRLIRGGIRAEGSAIFSTADGGATWTSAASGVSADLAAVCFVDATHGWVVGGGGTILVTADGGVTWTSQDSGSTDRFTGVAFTDALNGCAVSEYGTIVTTGDGGTTWTTRSTAAGGLSAVAFADASHGWAVGLNGTILATTDGGATWVWQDAGIGDFLSGVACSDASTVWAVGSAGRIVATVDGGATWSAQTSGTTAWLSAVAFTDATHGWAVGVNGTILATTTGGRDRGEITGTVRDAGLAGLEGIGVAAFRPDGMGGWELVASVGSGPGGIYRLGDLPAGTYRVKYRDDAGVYSTQFYNGQATITAAADVVVTPGASTTGIDAVLSADAGRIQGLVGGFGGPVAGIIVAAYRADGTGWSVVDSRLTGDDGRYDLRGLPPGTYRIEFGDPRGRYLIEYYDDAFSLADASDVAVAVGGTTPGIDAVLAADNHITGTVSNASLAGLSGIGVAAFDADGSGGWVFHSGVTSGAGGAYDITSLPPGTYRIKFRDAAGAYATQFYNGQVTVAAAADVVVTEGGSVSGIDAVLAADPGRITGTVTAGDIVAAGGRAASAAGAALAGIRVSAYRAAGAVWSVVDSTQTVADGTYELRGLPSGTYRVGFFDPMGDYTSRYYDRSATLAAATDVTVAAGGTTSAIDVTLWRPPLVGDFSPSSGYVGATVTVDGWSFSGATMVTFNGKVASGLHVVSDQRLTAVVPAGATSGPIAVTTPGGTSTSVTAFTVLPPTRITPTAPVASSSWPTGSTQTVTWTVSPAVASGEFRVWLVTPGGGWYVNKAVYPVAGRTSYFATITVTAPVGPGCKAYIYWRPNAGTGSWAASATSAAFSVIAGTAITITSPSTTSTWQQSTQQSVVFSLNPAMAGGELRIWLVTAGGGWYVNKTLVPTPGRTAYTVPVIVSAPVGPGCKAFVYWRPTAGTGAWVSTAKSAAFTVGPAPPIAVQAPTPDTRWRVGASHTVTWVVSPTVAGGEFRVWLVSAAGAWYVNKQVLPVEGQSTYSTLVAVSPFTPVGSGYKVYVYWRPTVGSGGWAATARSPAFEVVP